LKIVVIQNQQIIIQESTEESFGEVLINGNCVSNVTSGLEGGGCLIATAAFGSEFSSGSISKLDTSPPRMVYSGSLNSCAKVGMVNVPINTKTNVIAIIFTFIDSWCVRGGK